MDTQLIEDKGVLDILEKYPEKQQLVEMAHLAQHRGALYDEHKEQIAKLKVELDNAVRWRHHYESGNLFIRILKVCLR